MVAPLIEGLHAGVARHRQLLLPPPHDLQQLGSGARLQTHRQNSGETQKHLSLGLEIETDFIISIHKLAIRFSSDQN